MSYEMKGDEEPVAETIESGAGSDGEFLAQCRRGDEAGYRGLVARHGSMLWRIAHRITGSREDAEDLSQEAFIRAFRSLKRFRGRSKFSTYLCSIVVNLSLNHLRRRQRRPEASIDTTIARPPAGRESPRTRAQEFEFRAALEKELDALSPQLRASVALTAIEGMSHKEAATVLGCAESTVSWRVHEARKQLRQRLKAWRDGH